jgi:hypothetical protein
LLRWNAKLLRDDQEVRLMRFEEADQRREKRRLARSCAKLVRPNSGQVEKPLRPSPVAKR